MKIQNYHYLNQEIDVSQQFATIGNVHYNAQKLEGFDPAAGVGQLRYARFERKGRMGFNMYSTPFEPTQSWAFPPAYPDDPAYPFSVSLVGENVVRLRTTCRSGDLLENRDAQSLMLDGAPESLPLAPVEADGSHAVYRTTKLEVEVQYEPFHVILRDAEGRELTKTLHASDSKCLQNYNPMPFSYVRSSDDMRKYPAVSLESHPGEHYYGCGESFTKLDKSGQKLILWTKDANGVETRDVYKPVPFFMSSRGYGVFYHTSCPMTLDFGREYAQAQTAYMGDEGVDLFLFVGTPKEILGAYTDLTGKSPLPPLWSFGLWMSRITYKSEAEAREVARELKAHRIPCDVIHLDTGWFEEDWLCNYKFSPSRFDDPKQMIDDLNREGYRVCLWQIPYFTPKNEFFPELVARGLAVKDADGNLPTDDAVLDLSNPETVKWYQEKLGGLFQLGVSAIKADFGEAAPVTGVYASGASGFTEHNLYPLRYNKAVYDATMEYRGEGVIWGRSAWAGSQRYPLHWGGDCENNDMGMLSSLRGGLSFGASGFSYWSHDVGGFVRESTEELYNRWTFMGIFTSHMRCHGQPPKEPWAFSKEFCDSFRHMLELRYRLMPYIMAQSALCSQQGLPLLRAMFIQCPEDETCAAMEDQYFFGEDILVAPLFEAVDTRRVYLPAGSWVELGTGKVYEGERWHRVQATVYPGLAFVKAGAVLPMAEAALTTDDIDWAGVKYVSFSDGKAPAHGWTFCPETHGAEPIPADAPTVSCGEIDW